MIILYGQNKWKHNGEQGNNEKLDGSPPVCPLPRQCSLTLFSNNFIFYKVQSPTLVIKGKTEHTHSHNKNVSLLADDKVELLHRLPSYVLLKINDGKYFGSISAKKKPSNSILI